MKSKPWDLDRIYSRCEDVGGCWIWQGAVAERGYPLALIAGKTTSLRPYIHNVILGVPKNKSRLTYPICENTLCIAPKCIGCMSRSKYLTEKFSSVRPNIAIKKRRSAIESGRAIINYRIAEEIRTMPQPINRKEVSEKFGISVKTVAAVLSGRTWTKPISSIWEMASR